MRERDDTHRTGSEQAHESVDPGHESARQAHENVEPVPHPDDDWFDEPVAATTGAGRGAAAGRDRLGRRKAPPQPDPAEELPLHPADAGAGGGIGSRRLPRIPRVVVVHSPAEPPSERRGFKLPLKTIIFFGAAAIGLYFVWPQLVQFFDAVPGLRTIHWYWFAIMVLLEAASLASYWAMMRFTIDEHRWFVLATTQLSANAFSRIVPGGAASGGTISYQMLAAAGAPKGSIVTGLTATSLLSTSVLFLLPILSVPAIIGGAPINRNLLITLVIGIGVSLLLIGAGALLLFTDRTLRFIGKVIQRVLNRVKKVDPPRTGIPALLVDERDLIKETLGDNWWRALLGAAGNWLLDYAALLAALAAVGAQPRASLVLVAYVVAALLGMIPITPGGLGFVEVGLAATLGLAGVGGAEATTAVLAYRLVSFWLPIPTGLVAGLLFRRRFNGREAAAGSKA